MSICEIFDNPQKSLSVIAIVSILGMVAIGIIGFFVGAKSVQIVSSVQKTLEALLIAACGAKAGLALPGQK